MYLCYSIGPVLQQWSSVVQCYNSGPVGTTVVLYSVHVLQWNNSGPFAINGGGNQF